MGNKTLDKKIKRCSEWRTRLSETVQEVGTFFRTNNITDLRTHHQFEIILGSLADDNLSVAFVAEFSRGKSETINTIFFGDLKERVLPSGAGRTTMCPTELMYDPNHTTSIRLLPIESRKDKRPLFELKNDAKLWNEIVFDEQDTDNMVTSLAGMTSSKLVSRAYAQELNFDLEVDPESDFGLPVNEYDEVEIPSWRHALINLPHPLLEQGVVILDTPGLNEIGAEPELTISQLSTAHTVVFILSIDTGVTATDLMLWKEHLGGYQNNRKLVVLNKIDALWDGIRTEKEIEDEIQKQVTSTAKILKISTDDIFPISAQSGLRGKITNDVNLIQRSRVLDLEAAIAENLIPKKRQIVINKVRAGIDNIIDSAKLILENRVKDTNEHIAELKQLSSKNSDVISHIMLKVQSEKHALEKNMQRYQVLRSVYAKETNKLITLLSLEEHEKLIAITRHNMMRCVSTMTLQKFISKFFIQVNSSIDQAITQAEEIATLSDRIARDFEQDHGIVNFKVRRLKLEKFKLEIVRLEQKHSDLKNTKKLFFREQMSITNRFYESACMVTRKIFDRAFKEANSWNNNLMVPMETYVREHHTQLRRRLESLKRIHKASDTVDIRLQELANVKLVLAEQQQQFDEYQAQLSDLLMYDDDKQDTDAFENTETGAKILYWENKTSA